MGELFTVNNSYLPLIKPSTITIYYPNGNKYYLMIINLSNMIDWKLLTVNRNIINGYWKRLTVNVFALTCDKTIKQPLEKLPIILILKKIILDEKP